MNPLLIMIIAAAAALAQPAADPGGWSKAKWGMTEDQLAEAFGGDAIHLDARDQNGVRLVVLLDLAEIPCFAEMVPDRAGRLARVIVVPRAVANMTASLYRTLQELLVQKYGFPLRTVDKPGIVALQWAFPTTSITLIRSKVPSASSKVFAVEYRRITPDADKL